MRLNEKDVLEQSRTAMNQWEDLWRINATKNNEVYKENGKKLNDLLFMGTGRIGLVVAFGHSFEKERDIIHKYKKTNQFDVICVDKCFKYLDFDPEYVVLADAQVSDDWMGDKDTSNSVLIANICANPKWIQAWKGPVYFYVNKDNIESEKIFGKGGCSDVAEMIPASSNVGNAACVIASTILNHDRILLTGYDLSWIDDYYAFYNEHDDHNKSKKYWMSHRMTINLAGEIAQTSENLLFSSRWLGDFIQANPFQNIFNTTRNTILKCPYINLERQLRVAKYREISNQEKMEIVEKMKVSIATSNIDELNEVLKQGKDVFNIIVNILPKELKWLNLAK